MKRPLFAFAAGLAILTLSGCSFPSLGPPALLPTPLIPSSPTLLSATPAAPPTAKQSPLPTVAPSPTPFSTSTETPILKPTEVPTATLVKFSYSLGVTPDFAAKLSGEGIDSTVTGEKGSWAVSQVTSGWKQDGTMTTEQNVTIVSFENALVHNGGYPNGILKGTDSQGKTIFWSEEEKAWVRPLEMSTDIESPTFYPWDKQYLATESSLLNPNLNKPFSDEAVKKFAGWRIQFQYDETTGSSHAFLRPNSSDSIRWVLDENGKPVWFTTTTADGTVYESVLVQLLNPTDPKNPNADETIFAFATAGEWWTSSTKVGGYRDLFKSWYMENENFTKTLSPQIELAQRNGWFANHSWGSFIPRPSLDSLPSLPGNDPGKLETNSSYVYLPNNLTYIDELNSNNTILETQAFYTPLSPQLQSMLFPLFLAVK